MAKKQSLISNKKILNERNSDIFKEEITELSSALISTFFIRTTEFYRCLEVLLTWSIVMEMQYKVWTCITGWQDFEYQMTSGALDSELELTRPVSMDQSTMQPLNAIEVLDTFPAKSGCYVMIMPSDYMAQPAFQQALRVFGQRACFNNKRLFILTHPGTDVPKEIEDIVRIVEFKTPSHPELKDIYNTSLSSIEENKQPKLSNNDIDTIVQNSIGMTAYDFETAVCIALVRADARQETEENFIPTAQFFIDVIMETKTEVIKKTHILELLPKGNMNEVGGLDLLKDWIRKRRAAFSDEAKEFGIEPPRGILVVGPPGGGKSLIAKAIGSELQIPCIRLDIGRIFGSLVGESEATMRKVLYTIELMAPCILFLDEIDKGFGTTQGSGDSGVTSRVFGTFLTWMQERNGSSAPIFVLMTANNVVGLPPELIRKGRIDEIFAVTFPNERDRMKILEIHCKKRGHTLSQDDLQRVAKRTNMFVGAELESIVKDALIECFSSSSKKLTADALIAQAESIVPISRAFASKVQAMNKWAENNAKPASSDIAFTSEISENKRSDVTLRKSLSLKKKRRPIDLDD